jgi:hypothetical protein
VKIGVDDQFLRGKAKIPDFREINGSLGGKGGQEGLSIRIGAVNLGISTFGAVRLRMDLPGNGSLSNAMLTYDQNRAVTLGNAENGPLNLRLNRGTKTHKGKRLRLSLHGLCA